MAFPSSDAVLNSTADQDTSDPAADDGMNDAFGADLLQNLALRGLGTKEAAAAQPQHTSMRVQARALYRKSAIYQARNLSTNICIISAPVLFCILLLLLTAGVQQLMMGEEFKCGCQCTKCCYQGNTKNCTIMQTSTCPYTCLERSSSNCGVQFSVGTQAAFCDLPHPSTWPAIVQTPQDEDRAAINKPQATILYTPGLDPALTDKLSEGLLPKPVLQANTVLAAQQYLATALQDLAGDLTVRGEALALLGLKRLGSCSVAKEAAGLYLEAALAPASRSLYALWPEGTCRHMGLQDKVNTSLITALQAMVNASNSAVVAALLNGQISNLDSAAGGQNAAAAAMVSDVTVNCTEVVLTKLPSTKQLQRALFCGNRMAACAGKKVTNSFAGAYDWANTSETAFAPVVYFNDTFSMPDDGSDVGSKYTRKPQLLNMAVNSWMSTVLGPGVSAELLAVGSLPKKAWPYLLDWTPVLGPVLATWLLQFLLPVFVSQLVYEKEKKLRMMMKMHGLLDRAYWLVQYSWFLMLYCVYASAFLAFGTITKLAIFKYNDYGIQIALLFVWGNAMIALAFLISCFFTSTRTATVFCYLFVFAMGLFGYLMMRFLLDLQPVVPGYVYWIDALQIVPPLALYRGLYELGSYAHLGIRRLDIGMTAASLHDPSNGMLGVWGMLAGEWTVMMVLAWYLEQVYASGTGNRRHPLYFLDWLKGGARQQQEESMLAADSSSKDPSLPVSIPSNISRTTSGFKAVFGKSSPVKVTPIKLHVLNALGVGKVNPSVLNLASTGSATAAAEGEADAAGEWSIAAAEAAEADALAEPADVTEERLRTADVDDYVENPLVIRGLHKVYPAQDGQAPKLAVRRLDLAVSKGECFGLLGPNGAGKSTSISMLVGLQQPSAGTAIIGGNDISKGMRPIFGIMGLCPQHDLLWGALSGREHLRFYGTLKGMSGPELDATIESCLKAVKLWSNGVADKPSGSYSGGMKRRLSVAISLMGNPKVVYLDEPSTGLDPASRRVLWDVIKAAKPGRAIILTTHNMEEAEVLCDRLGIFVSGRLACIGHPKDITSRFCGYLLLTLSVAAEREAAARELVTGMAPGAQLTYNVGGTLKYELPTHQVSLSRVFATMAGVKAAELGVIDWAVANATMEEVFIKITQQMNLKATI